MTTHQAKRVSIITALSDCALFGGLPPFRTISSWHSWIVFLKAAYGLSLDAGETAVFCKHTGRSKYAPPPDGWPEVVAITGRQSGKTRIAAAIAAFEAMTAPIEGDGTDLYAVLIAQDTRGALRSLFSYCRAIFDGVPLLMHTVRERRAETLSLESGCTLAVYPCRAAATRGIRARVVVLDELAHYRNSENLPVDREMLRAIRPTLATTAGKLVILSSPYAQTGALWELHRRHYGRDDDASTLIWCASAPEMNPLLPADYLLRMEQDDPDAYRSEVLGEFRSGIATFLAPEAIDAVVDIDTRERPPAPGADYVAGFDPSGGRRDCAALAIAHSTGGGCATLDLVRAWAPPHDPSLVISEAAAVLKTYGIGTVLGDRFGAEFVVAAFREHGIRYQAAVRDRSALYLELLPLINAARIRLLDDAELLRELRGLERRRGATRDSVDHRPSAHDDRAIAATIALVHAVATTARMDRKLLRSCLEAGHIDPDTRDPLWARRRTG